MDDHQDGGSRPDEATVSVMPQHQQQQSESNLKAHLYRIGQLVSTKKKINQLERKRAQYTQMLQAQNAKLKQQKKEYAQLKSIYEYYEYQSYEELMEEIQNIMQSNDYQSGQCQHLQDQVKELKQKAPGLEMYGRSQEFIKELKSDILELEHYLRDTCEDLKRLKIRFKYLMKKKVSGRADVPNAGQDKNFTTAKKRRGSALTAE